MISLDLLVAPHQWVGYLAILPLKGNNFNIKLIEFGEMDVKREKWYSLKPQEMGV